jgi:type II secretory pathway component PulF
MPQKEKKGLLDLDISLGGISTADKIVFVKHLAVMLKAGLTVSESLEIVLSQAKGKFKKILEAVQYSVESGNSLAGSLAKFPKVFSNILVNTALAGEASGTLEKNLDNVSEQLKKNHELVTKVKSAMVYPVIVMIGTLILGIAMSYLVLPKITPMFEGLKIKLPFYTRALVWFSHFMQEYGIIFIVILAAAAGIFVWVAKQPFAKPVTHFILLNTPIIKNITHNANLANFCRTLGTLLKSGLNIDVALNITKDTAGNYYYAKTLKIISDRISQGAKLSDNLNEFSRLFPRLLTSMIRVGEKSGKLEESLFYLAEFYEAEVDVATKTLSTAIEPILLIVIGVSVGGLAISIISPIYQITGNVAK